MSGWFDRMFGIVTEVGKEIATDFNAKVILEGWFGRKTPETPTQGDMLDRLYASYPELFSIEPDRSSQSHEVGQHSPDHDHGIDR